MKPSTPILAVASLCVILAGSIPARACAFHGTANMSALSADPGAIAVALAVSKARKAGLLKPNGPKQTNVERWFRYHRVVKHLRGLSECAGAGEYSGIEAPGPLSILVVEPGMWSRLHRDGDSPDLTLDIKGPGADDPVLYIAEAALQPLSAGDITPAEAVRRGLVASSGDPGGKALSLVTGCFGSRAVQSDARLEFRPNRP